MYHCYCTFVANLADYDTRDDAPCTVQQRVHLHPGAYRAIMALCRCTDAANGQMLDVF